MPNIRIVVLPAPGPVAPDARAITAALDREFRSMGADFVSGMAQYPPQAPTTYRRSGQLGRNWKITRIEKGLVEVSNNVTGGDTAAREASPSVGKRRARRARKARKARAYAVYVQGPIEGSAGKRQTAVMAGKGWQSVDTVAEAVLKRHEGAIIRVLVEGI